MEEQEFYIQYTPKLKKIKQKSRAEEKVKRVRMLVWHMLFFRGSICCNPSPMNGSEAGALRISRKQERKWRALVMGILHR